MRKPYEPMRGTIPFRVIEHLRGLPAGTEISSVELEETLDISRGSLGPLLAAPRKHGLLRSRNKPDNMRLLFWSLGDGTPDPMLPDHEEDEPLHPPGGLDSDAVHRTAGKLPNPMQPTRVRIERATFSVAIALDGA